MLGRLLTSSTTFEIVVRRLLLILKMWTSVAFADELILPHKKINPGSYVAISAFLVRITTIPCLTTCRFFMFLQLVKRTRYKKWVDDLTYKKHPFVL